MCIRSTPESFFFTLAGTSAPRTLTADGVRTLVCQIVLPVYGVCAWWWLLL